MELLVITGLSGAGKTRAANICEDLDFYCVDNLPAALLPRFAALCGAAQGRYERVALVMDVRSVGTHEELLAAMEALDQVDGNTHIIFLEADYETILRRYKESRRRHPLAAAGESIQQALEREILLLAPLRERADLVINTAGLSLNRLKSQIRSLAEPGGPSLAVNVMSFGYKHGIPPEADMVFDVRCLANPYYIDTLRDRTGLDPDVAEYIFRDGNARTMVDKLADIMAFSIPLYEQDRAELTIAIGCTGGHHRSVAVAQALMLEMDNRGFTVAVSHRDMEK